MNEPPPPPPMPEILREDGPKFETPGQKKQRKREERRSGPEMRAIAIGLDFAAMVAGGCILGFAADTWRGTFPRWTAVGGIVGVVSGGWTAIKLSLKLNRDMERMEQEKRRARSGGDPEGNRGESGRRTD